MVVTFWHLELTNGQSTHLLHHPGLFPYGILGYKGCSYLLSDPPGLSVLDVGPTDLVKDLCLPCVHVTKHTDYRGAKSVL